MSRDWVGYDALSSAQEIFEQNRGIWYLNPERVEWESYATFSLDGTIIAVAAIEGIQRLPWRDADDSRAVKSAITGRALGLGIPLTTTSWVG